MTAPIPAAPVAPEVAPVAPPVAPPAPSAKGFPAETPVADMTAEEQAAYWKHYARRNEDNLKALNGITPDQLKELQAELGQLRDEKLTADEKALKQAQAEAAKAARAQADAEYLPKLQALRTEAAVSSMLTPEQLPVFMSMVDPSAFFAQHADGEGNLDAQKVQSTLAVLFPGRANPVPAQRFQNAGQFTQPPANARLSAAQDQAREQLARRFPNKT